MKTKKHSLLLISHEKPISNKIFAVLKQIFQIKQLSFDENYGDSLKSESFNFILLVGLQSPMDIHAKLRALYLLPKVPPIILISDITDANFIVQSYRYGVIDYVQVPIDMGELISVLHHQIKKFSEVPTSNPETGLVGLWQKIKPELNLELTNSEMGIAYQNSLFSSSIAPDNVAFLHVQFFGKFRINFENQNIEKLFGKRAKHLVSFLLHHHKKSISREKLIEIFWPYHAHHAAKNNLNVTIHGIRKVFQRLLPDVPILTLENDCYQFSPNIIIQTDCDQIEQFHRNARAIVNNLDQKNATKELKGIISLYQGDFLESMYEPWMEKRRENYREIYLYSLNQLSQLYFEIGQYLEAIKYNKLMLEKDNCMEDIHRKLMLCYHKLGRQSKVIRQFQKCQKVLQQELEMVPSKKTIALLTALRQGSTQC